MKNFVFVSCVSGLNRQIGVILADFRQSSVRVMCISA